MSEHSGGIHGISFSRDLRPSHTDPRFVALLSQIGLDPAKKSSSRLTPPRRQRLGPDWGATGFLRALNPSLLAFADYKGNRQLLSTGNLAVHDRVTLFLMDYPKRTRLKIIGHARVEDAAEHPELFAQLAEPGIVRASRPDHGGSIDTECRRCPWR